MAELAIPCLRILDVDRAKRFYVDLLGFEVSFEAQQGPDFPIYMGITRGALVAHLSSYEASGPPGDGRGMTLQVDDVDGWWARVRDAAGVTIERGPTAAR